MDNYLNLEGKLIIVTGASSGIGRETALKLSEQGAKCIIVGRREENLRNVLNSMKGEGHEMLVLDLNNPEVIADAVKNVVKSYGKIDGLVYSAGVSGTRPIKNVDKAYLESVMNVNFYSYIEFVRQISARTNHNEGCRIVAVSSVGSRYPEKAMSAYAASKAAMDAATRSLAIELASKGICLNTVRPGMIETEMTQKVSQETGTDHMEAVKDRQFLGAGAPQDVSNMIMFLLSPMSRFVTGQCVFVDGGYTCH